MTADRSLPEGVRLCGGKIRYPGRARARRAARVRGDNQGVKLRVYLCPVCGDWHLTSKLARQAPGVKVRGFRRGPRARTLDELEALAKKMRGDP